LKGDGINDHERELKHKDDQDIIDRRGHGLRKQEIQNLSFLRHHNQGQYLESKEDILETMVYGFIRRRED